MKTLIVLAGTILAVIGSANLAASEALDELNSGPSVFDVPTPTAPSFPTAKPGKVDRLVKAYSTAPPQINHRTAEYLPITMEDNGCLDCHDRRKLLSKTWRKGKKLPMPDSHYGSFDKPGNAEDVAGARYNCMQCHVAQSDAPLVVESSFK